MFQPWEDHLACCGRFVTNLLKCNERQQPGSITGIFLQRVRQARHRLDADAANAICLPCLAQQLGQGYFRCRIEEARDRGRPHFDECISYGAFFFLIRLTKPCYELGYGNGGIVAHAAKQIDCLLSLGRVFRSQTLNQVWHCSPAVGAKAQDAAEGFLPQPGLFRVQCRQKQCEQPFAVKANSVQGVQPGNLGLVIRLLRQALGQVYRGARVRRDPNDRVGCSRANRGAVSRKPLHDLRISHIANPAKRGSSREADAFGVISQQVKQSRCSLT